MMGEAEAIIGRFTPIIADLMTDSMVAAWLVGAAEMATRLVGAGGTGTRPAAKLRAATAFKYWRPIVEAATADLASRKVVSKEDYEALRGEARQQAFTVAGERSLKTLTKIRDALARATADGTDPVEPVQLATRTSPLGPGEMENVWRTNVASGRSRGLDHVLEQTDLFPYEQTLVIDDANLTELCDTIRKSGIQKTDIFQRDDPVYQKFKSPRHWQCRCSRRPMTVREAARRGIKSAIRWLKTGKPQKDWVKHPKAELMPGWMPAP